MGESAGVRFDGLYLVSHLVGPRVWRGHDADVDLEHRLVGRGGDGEGVPLRQEREAILEGGASQVEVVALAVGERLDTLIGDGVVELRVGRGGGWG